MTGTEERPEPEERSSVTHHVHEGQAYTATAGTLAVRDGEGAAKASLFHVAYVLDRGGGDASNLTDRPVTFVFNGGPGSSSVWLHLGLFGPERVQVPTDLRVAPPYPVGPNPRSLLPFTDLVFIDPVSTGFSRAAAGEDPKQFHGIDEDVACLAELIRLWCTRNHRWTSPKYLAGESYGTARAAELARHLQDRHGMNVNGLVFISAILNFATARTDRGNDLAFALALPTYAAAALHHGRLAPGTSLERVTAEVEDFALDRYLPTLLRASRATERERTRLAGAVARFTGLSRSYVERCNLRVEPSRFRKELLRQSGCVIGRFDARYAAPDADGAADGSDHDPSNSAVQGAYTAAVNDYLCRHLGYEDDMPYEVLNSAAVQPWNFGDKGRGRYVDASEALHAAMARNHGMRVFLASGYHDLATPYFASEWAIDHMALDGMPSQQVATHRYQGGHMMYLHEPELGLLHDDLAAFLQGWRP
ncbi:MAG TPA: hypothetical protein VFA94_06530 [Acidimicrobiales bacterium]|nr:hypothetical protein [Acidimicrobiales bacterium]